MEWDDIMRMHELVESGGGVLMTGGAPFYVVGNSVDLEHIAAFFGARHYGNCAGPMKILRSSYLTQELNAKMCFRAARSAACVHTPHAGVPVASYAASARLISVLVNTYGEGRCAYLWRALGDSANPREHENLLLRTLCWLACVDVRP